MPTPTYTPLANITLGSNTQVVNFDSIPGIYRDLVLVVEAVASTGTIDGRIRLNADTGSNYSWQKMIGNGSAVSANVQSPDTAIRISDTALGSTTQALTAIIQIMDYSATNKHKTVMSRANNASTGVEAGAGRWANTAAVTRVRFYTTTNLLGIGSTLSLYGIVA